MTTAAIVFIICSFLVGNALFYGVLYCATYTWLNLDERIGDDNLCTIISILSLLLGLAFLDQITHILYIIFF